MIRYLEIDGTPVSDSSGRHFKPLLTDSWSSPPFLELSPQELFSKKEENVSNLRFSCPWRREGLSEQEARDADDNQPPASRPLVEDDGRGAIFLPGDPLPPGRPSDWAAHANKFRLPSADHAHAFVCFFD